MPYWIKSEGAAETAGAIATATPAAGGPTAAQSPGAGGSATAPHALAWLGALLAIALLLAAPWAITRYLRAPKVAESTASGPGVVIVQPPRTIAVLPLIDMSPDRSNAYLGDGLAQELAARLARLPGVPVAASTSAFAFRNRTTDARTIAQTLGVRHILEGSVHREGDRLRVTAQLIDGASGYDLWSAAATSRPPRCIAMRSAAIPRMPTVTSASAKRWMPSIEPPKPSEPCARPSRSSRLTGGHRPRSAPSSFGTDVRVRPSPLTAA